MKFRFSHPVGDCSDDSRNAVPVTELPQFSNDKASNINGSKYLVTEVTELSTSMEINEKIYI
ncbi:MAG: hypothetical protein KMY55_14635 [Dethiosulfatibacter sp.]|nr:hypothetical protein [Dethiosulfatibacter sp.]